MDESRTVQRVSRAANDQAERRIRPERRLDLEAWDDLVDREILIDLAEWAEARGREPLARYRCAFTRDLWSLLEQIPFSEIGRTSIDARIRALHGRASRALERALRDLPVGLLPSQIEVEFRAPVWGNSASSLRLHASLALSMPLAMVLDRAGSGIQRLAGERRLRLGTAGRGRGHAAGSLARTPLCVSRRSPRRGDDDPA